MKSGEAPWFGFLPVEGDVPFAINPELDLDALRAEFARNRRIQIRNVLAPETAERLYFALARETPYGLAYNENGEPRFISREELAKLPPQEQHQLISGILQRAGNGEYSYAYNCYPILDDYLANRNRHLYVHRWIEYVNSDAVTGLVRHVTGFDDLLKADAQATYYSRNQFLFLHTDSHVQDGWRVAYVLNMCKEWKEDFGGYLLFYDDEGNVTQGFKPAFNTLNMFAVPQRHSVSYVPTFAPPGRFALTGWFRNK
ncbi:2OG-Fe(II) oxygenase [Pedomonas sp. V897]|uniref:2OG-Fe(II) oxygenase n=1 Tax=Pedomonas sp. V897 TaxID=3446482 RepID=UPI003EE2C07A